MDFKKLLIIPVVFAMLAVPALASDPYINPDNPAEFPMEALISGTGSPPIIKMKFELPDESPEPGTQFYPTLSGERTLLAYAVVTDPQGRDDIGSVYADVYHPNIHEGEEPETKSCGSFKYQVHCDKMNVGSVQEPGPDQQEALAALDQALNAGLINEAQWEDAYEELVNVEDAYMYRCELLMDYNQPCGEYRVEVWAADTSGEISERLINFFDYVCVTAVEFDFRNINFGEIAPSVEKVVGGDYDITTPDRPSLKNEGNTLAEIGLLATPLVGQELDKEIIDFDAKFREQKIYFAAGDQIWFNNLLQLGHTEKISFSVHAPLGTPNDTYLGTVTIFVSDPGFEPCSLPGP